MRYNIQKSSRPHPSFSFHCHCHSWQTPIFLIAKMDRHTVLQPFVAMHVRVWIRRANFRDTKVWWRIFWRKTTRCFVLLLLLCEFVLPHHSCLYTRYKFAHVLHIRSFSSRHHAPCEHIPQIGHTTLRSKTLALPQIQKQLRQWLFLFLFCCCCCWARLFSSPFLLPSRPLYRCDGHSWTTESASFVLFLL